MKNSKKPKSVVEKKETLFKDIQKRFLIQPEKNKTIVIGDVLGI